MSSFLHILTGTARGGCESNAICMIRETPQYRHMLLVLGREGEMSGEFTETGAKVTHCPIPSRRASLLIKAVARAVAEANPDGILIWHGMVALPGILRALHDYRGVVLVHGGNPASSMSRLVDWRYFLTEKLLGRRCNATYVCCSRYVADSFEKSRYLRRFPRIVVPNGVRAPNTHRHSPRPLSRDDSVTIGMIARLDEIKDHPTLLHAFSMILEAYPSARLELAGDGTRRAHLEAIAAELGISAQVRFLGMVGDVYETLARWDLFAYATTEEEGQGIALAEAMMAGLPCVVTEIGPIAEVAGYPPAVALVPSRDPASMAQGAIALLDDLPRRLNLSERAEARALSEFSGAVFAARYAELILTRSPRWSGNPR